MCVVISGTRSWHLRLELGIREAIVRSCAPEELGSAARWGSGCAGPAALWDWSTRGWDFRVAGLQPADGEALSVPLFTGGLPV